MNTIEHTSLKQFLPKTGEIFCSLYNSETYILVSYNGTYSVVNLATGDTYNGFRGTISEAFDDNIDNFVKVTQPFTITPCSD